MSSFDDEFGLFGEGSDEFERRSTLGARKIASSETVIDEIEPEEEEARRPARPERPDRVQRPRRSSEYPRKRRGAASPTDPWAGHRKATQLLSFLSGKLVQSPEKIGVELFMDEDGRPVIELVVDPEDLGKVIGRNGRVAHALRTIVRATAEDRVAVDIFDSDEAAQTDGEEPAD